MASIVTGLGDLLKSIYEIILSALQSILGLSEGVVGLFVNFLASVVRLCGDTAKGVFNVLGGLGSFLFANAAVVGVLAVVAYVYLGYQRQQGRPVVVNGKKVN